MARILIELPSHIIFSTDINVRITDINYGGHLGNDAVLSIIHEGRMRFFKSQGFTELDIQGTGLVIADSAVVYKSQTFYGDTLRLDMGVDDLGAHGCDIYYRLFNRDRKTETARAKTGIVFYDYQARKIAPVPSVFRQLVDSLASPWPP